MEKIKEIFVVIENKPGEISKLCRLLKKKNISISGIGVYEDVARLYVSNPEKTLGILHDLSYQADVHEVLAVILPNKAGTLFEVTQKLANAGINILSLYSTMLSKQKKAMVILEVDKTDLAVDIFKTHKY